MRAKDFITEVLDSKVQYQTDWSNTDQFTSVLPITPEREIVFVAEESVTDSWYIEFYQRNPQTRKTTYKLTGNKEEFKIFSFVMKSLIQFIGLHNPETVYFSASKEEKSRSSLYTRLIQKYTQQLGYELKRIRQLGNHELVYTLVKKHESVTEAPLPPDWDKSKFAPNKYGEIDFAEMVAYAQSQAKTLGKGSSRIAMVIPYQGRETVLKVAISESGLAQNKAEAKVLSTDWVKNSGMAIPIIDYDEDNPSPTWIHMEKAEPLSERNAQALFGEYGVLELIHYIRSNEAVRAIIIDEMIRNGWPDAKLERFIEFVMFIEALDKQFNVRAGDFHQLENWGVYRNEPVLIDLGFTKDVWIKYYGGIK